MKVGTLYLCTCNTYSTLATTNNDNAMNVTIDVARTYSKMWHHRLGNMSKKGMKILHSKNLFPGLKNIYLEFYETVFIVNRKESDFSELGKKKRLRS